MDWQKEFDNALTECTVTGSKIFTIADEFAEFEDRHGLFDTYLGIKRGVRSSDITGTIQIVLGFPIICGVGGGMLSWFLSNESEHITIIGAVIGIIVGILLAILILKKVPNASDEDATKRTIKYIVRTKNTSEKVAEAIVREQQRLIGEQDALIEGEWRNVLGRLHQLMDCAPSPAHILKNDDNYSKMKELDTIFSSITREARQKYESANALKNDLKKSLKIAAGIAIVAAGVALVIGGASKRYWDDAYPD